MALFVMLNPSTADATKPDPTMTRCVNFAKSWGYDGVAIVNLFAFRSTDPEALRKVADPVGPHNDSFIRIWGIKADLVVLAWGSHPFAAERAKVVLGLLGEVWTKLHYLKLTKDGHPCHPLRLSARLRPIPWEVVP